MSVLSTVIAQIRDKDFSISSMPVLANNEVLVSMSCEALSILFTQERFAKFAEDVAAFAAKDAAQ